MKVKELIRQLEKQDNEADVQIEIAVFDATLHSTGAIDNDFVVLEANMRDANEKPIVIIGGYAGEDQRKR